MFEPEATWRGHPYDSGVPLEYVPQRGWLGKGVVAARRQRVSEKVSIEEDSELCKGLWG